jgi:plasmid stabilization system protein ParE
MLPIILSPEAEKEVVDSYWWYEEQLFGLGDEFILCLDAEMHSISRNSEIYQVVHKNIRRGILKRFPYCVFFIKEPNHIQVLAVFNAHRNPSDWKKRKNK